MSENLHDIDDLFRKAIEGTTEDPSPQVWTDISKTLDDDKSRRPKVIPFFWRWFAAACLIGGALLVFTLMNRSKTDQTASGGDTGKGAGAGKQIQPSVLPDETAQQKPDAPVIQTDPDKTADVPLNTTDKTTTPHQKESTDNTTLHKSDKQNETAVNKPADRIRTDSRIKLNSPDKGANTRSEIIAGQNSKNSLRNQRNNILKQNPEDIQLAVENGKQKRIKNSPNSIKQTNEPAVKDNTGTADIFNVAQKPGLLPESFSWNQNALHSFWQPASPPELAGRHYFPPSYYTSNTAKAKTIKLAKRSGGFALTPFYSPDITWRSIQDNEDDHYPGGPGGGSHHEDHNDIRNFEHEPVSWTAGVLAEKSFGGKLGLQTGLTYTHISIRQADRLVYAERDEHGEVGYRVNCSSGYTIVNSKTGAVVTPNIGDSTSIHNTQNTFSYINVPLLLQYRMGKGKLQAAIKAGPQISFLAKGQTKASIQTSPTGKTPVVSDVQGMKKISPEGVVGISAEYKLNKMLSVVIAPSTRFSLGSVNSGGTVSSRSNTFGVNAGLRISL